MSVRKLIVLVCAVVGLSAIAARADTIFSAIDPSVGTSSTPRPNSQAAQTGFDTAAGAFGPVIVNTLEAVPLGFAPVINLGGGVTATYNAGADPSTLVSGIRNSPNNSLGFSIAPGTKFLGIAPDFSAADVTVTFAFASAVRAFGFYTTSTESDLQGTLTVNYSNGSNQVVPILKGAPGAGGVGFLGVISSGLAINSFTIKEAGPFNVTRDIWGVDDLRYVNANVVPLPAAAWGGFALIGAIGGWRARRRAGEHPAL